MLIFCWDGRFCFVFWGFGVGFRDWKQRVLLAFFVKTDYILKVGIFVLNGGNIFFFLNYQSRVRGGGVNSWILIC